jgi:putative ABC transport system permease protein
VVIGLVLGAGSAALLLGAIGSVVLQNFLFGVNAHDPLIYSSVAALLASVAAVSCLVPALRATRVNPMVALRAE